MLHNIWISAVAIVTQVSEPWPVGLLLLFALPDLIWIILI